MFTKERLEPRQAKRAEAGRHVTTRTESILLLISETLDDYLEHRIQNDKAVQLSVRRLEGILQDIQGDVAGINLK